MNDKLDYLEKEIEKIFECQENNLKSRIEIISKISELSTKIENLQSEWIRTRQQIDRLRVNFDNKIQQIENFKNKLIGIAVAIPVLISIIFFIIQISAS